MGSSLHRSRDPGDPQPPVYWLGGRRFTHGEWEAICDGCGLCCYEKAREHGRVVSTGTPCRFLADDRRCRVYGERFEACGECVKVTPEVVRQGEVLPDACPYVLLWREIEEEEAEGALGRRGGRRRP